jgi:hypothetical protein
MNGVVNINAIIVTGVVSTDGQTITGTVNLGGGGSVPPSVLAHISRTDNPHRVTENQLEDGLDYTLIFENALTQ